MLRGNPLILEENSATDGDAVEAILELCSRHEPILADESGDAGLPDLSLF